MLLQKVIGHPFDHFACGICELHATPFMLAIYRWENLIQEKQNGGEFKILFTIHGFYTHEGLSNYTTFRPIQSGATVPLTHPQPWFCKLFVKYFNILSKAPFPKVRVCTIPCSCCDLLRRKGWQISAQNLRERICKELCVQIFLHSCHPASRIFGCKTQEGQTAHCYFFMNSFRLYFLVK